MEMPISCAAISCAVDSACTNEAACSVIFTVGWKGAVTNYTLRPLEEVINEEGEVEISIGDQVQLSSQATYQSRRKTPGFSSGDIRRTKNSIKLSLGTE